jgi:Cu2+-exporting ATPase
VSVSLRGASTVATDAAQVIRMEQRLTRLCDLFDFGRMYQTHIRTTFLAGLIPHLISMRGALFFGFGFVRAAVLAQLGLFAGLAHAMLPRGHQAA